MKDELVVVNVMPRKWKLGSISLVQLLKVLYALWPTLAPGLNSSFKNGIHYHDNLIFSPDLTNTSD